LTSADLPQIYVCRTASWFGPAFAILPRHWNYRVQAVLFCELLVQNSVKQSPKSCPVCHLKYNNARIINYFDVYTVLKMRDDECGMCVKYIFCFLLWRKRI